MNYKKLFLFPFILFASLDCFTQAKPEKSPIEADSMLVESLLKQSKLYFTDSPFKALSLATEAKTLAEKIHFRSGEAYALKNFGIISYYQGKYLEALQQYRQSLQIFEDIGDNVGISNINNNIGVIYYDQGDDAKSLEYYLQSLKYAELAGDSLRVLTALNNVGAVYYMKKSTHDKALEYYKMALPISEALGRQDELGTIAVNIGSIYSAKKEDSSAMVYFNKSLKAYGNAEGGLNAYNGIGKLYTQENKFDSALKTHNQALTLAEKLNVKISIAQSLMGLGNVYVKKGEFQNAIVLFKKAEIAAKEIKANHELQDLYEAMYNAYSKTGDYNNAFKYQSLFSTIKDTLYNIETAKKLGSIQFDFDLQKKQGEINLLTKDKDLNELQIKRQKLARNALGGGLAFVVLIAVIIFKNYRAKVKTNKVLDEQKDQIEDLLLNILPSEVAKELQVSGQATPRYYESVPVMFTDFKNFTIHADKLSPQDLVEELNTCFIAFDNIIENYNLEKIKTIGDSYMCAGGIRISDEQQAYNVIRASLDIQEYIVHNNKRRIETGLDAWYLRIGIHVGPVVAGVVGKKKYAYDIWGSTVNIASRMESNGAPGQVNISSSTYELVKQRFLCSYRGKINAKNVGEIDMYFVEKELGLSKDNLTEDSSINEDRSPLLNG